MSKPMNAAQREHAKNRASGIAKAAIEAVKEKNTTKAVVLTDGEKLALIDKGTVKLVPKPYPSTYLIHAFDFSKHEKAAVLSPVGKAKITKINKALEDAVDSIILGDASEALTGLKAFEAAVAKI